MSSKTIAFIVSYFPTVSQTFIVNQINGLIDLGYSVKLYAYKKANTDVIHDSIKRNDLLKNVNYFVAPPSSKFKRVFTFFQLISLHFFNIKWRLLFKCLNIFKYGKDAYTLKLVFEAQWFLLPYDFKLIHAHFGMNGNRMAYLKAHGIIDSDVKLITTFHGYDLMPSKLNKYKTKYKYLFEESHAFTVNTPYLEELLTPLNTYQKPCYVLPVGFETSLFKRATHKKNDTYFDIVFCGNLIPLKGPDIAIDIVHQLHLKGYTNVRLHVIGQGKMQEKLQEQVSSYGLINNIVFYGSKSQLFFKTCLEQADIFVLPGRYDPETKRAETQGLVIQEAQAMELPVIVSDVGGIPYGLIPNKTGFVIKENDIEGFVEAVIKLINNNDLKLKMGRQGRIFAVENYDNDILIVKLQNIYNNALSKL